ncbi:helix-turn-helix domain-containing protein [Actinomadura opuntiae]|uniref:helix-turn-helix domain-containing protein n=1 Tax=Actinomadura sp. OS1-43 TaxID=604315 RepID=UPI00255AADCB|nr:helix-turn-helix domain-containing protein [Actinomadura sp. OS1-43]MDL4819661.1 helix-turn-helix domain-containing protein [Actinomadura sp. OS1-43]
MDDGAYQLALRRSDQLGCVRTAGQVRRERADGYRFLLPLDGELTLAQDGREARLRPGTGGLVTLAAPFRVGVVPRPAALRGVRPSGAGGPARAFVMTIPAREMDRRLRRPSPVATGLDLSAGLGRVVADMVRAVGEERRALSAPQFDAACDRITELLCVIVAGRQRPPAAPGHLAEVEAVVRRYVREHATDPGLTGAAMAQDLGWSLRQVQLALQHAGTTPRELIREERLRLVRDRLRNPQDRDVTITDLAHATGFSSASALSTAFRRRYGVSPRELRHAAH